MTGISPESGGLQQSDDAVSSASNSIYQAQNRTYRTSLASGRMTPEANEHFGECLQSFGADLLSECQLLHEDAVLRDPQVSRVGLTEGVIRSANRALRRRDPPPPPDKWKRRKFRAIQLLALLATLAVGVLGSYLKDNEIVRLAFAITLIIAIAASYNVMRQV